MGKMNKVLINSSSEFISSHVADTLEENGFQVNLFNAVSLKYKLIGLL